MGDGLIGVTGATGHVGGGVARRLAERDVPYRAIVRDAGRAPHHLGSEVREAPGGYADRDGLRAALDGVTTLFLVPGHESEHRADDDVRSDDVERLTGHRPRTLAEYVAEHPETLAHLAGGGH
ncbi:MAG: NAD(P)H-binding protein [Solirubrobacterales bacterium]|nr:NAD(P)H-binding protein [Solirubrobacterales bacterium]